MDCELLDCFTPFSGHDHDDSRPGAGDRRMADPSRQPSFRGGRWVPSSGAAADRRALDAIDALAGSLTPAMRAECRKRAEKRAFSGLGDVSDPCICGEAQLLMEAARQGAGRAPAACFDGLGDVR